MIFSGPPHLSAQFYVLRNFSFQIVHIRKSFVSGKYFEIPVQHAETNRVSKGDYTEPVPAVPFGRRRQFDFLGNFKIELLWD